MTPLTRAWKLKLMEGWRVSGRRHSPTPCGACRLARLVEQLLIHECLQLGKVLTNASSISPYV
nr:hypothetical protein Q903MT_gene697 [Picea sitchensis]